MSDEPYYPTDDTPQEPVKPFTIIAGMSNADAATLLKRMIWRTIDLSEMAKPFTTWYKIATYIADLQVELTHSLMAVELGLGRIERPIVNLDGTAHTLAIVKRLNEVIAEFETMDDE